MVYFLMFIAAAIRVFTLGIGSYFIYYGVDLLLTGDAKTIPFVSISPNGIEGRELPIAAFICIIGLTLVAFAVFAKTSARNRHGTGVKFREL